MRNKKPAFGDRKIIPLTENMSHANESKDNNRPTQLPLRGVSSSFDADDVDGDDYPDDNKTVKKKIIGDFGLYGRINDIYRTLTYGNIKKEVRWLIENAACKFKITFDDILLLMTLFVLFSSDIEILTLPKKADYSFMVATAICLFVFIFEFLVNTWCKSTFKSLYPFVYEGYVFSFFWFLDLIAILSLFPDIDFIANNIGLADVNIDTSAGRVVRLVRLVRIVRLYRIALDRQKKAQQEAELLNLVRTGQMTYDEMNSIRSLDTQRQSRLGTQLSDSTTQRVIVMVLILLIVVPQLQYAKSNYGFEFTTKAIHQFNINQKLSTTAKKAAVDSLLNSIYGAENNRYILYADVTPSITQSPYVYFKAYIEHLRDNWIHTIQKSNTINNILYNTTLKESNLSQFFQIAVFSILLTIFTTIMLVGGSVVFTNDAEKLVIAPIERMMNMVDAVAANPLAPLHFDESNANAGAGIISANLGAQGSATLNPLLPGVRIYGIFGFCDIHHFEDINRLLTNDVLTFVNTIAEIVHNSVHEWAGQCNKNLGNAFVIVWRIGDEGSLVNHNNINPANRSSIIERAPSTIATPEPSPLIEKKSSMKMIGNKGISFVNNDLDSSSNDSLDDFNTQQAQKRVAKIDLRRIPGVDVLADKALIGYVKIIAEINRNKNVLAYRNEPRLTNDNTEEFKVRMGFGLHAGWAIEGAVGSLQKVDATYLSPHVNMAARLETSSRQYGVPLLASQDFYDLMSNEGQSYCRRLDVVTVKGSEVPIGIYTYDANQEYDFKRLELEETKAARRQRRPSIESKADIGKNPSVTSLPSVNDNSEKGVEMPSSGSNHHTIHATSMHGMADDQLPYSITIPSPTGSPIGSSNNLNGLDSLDNNFKSPEGKENVKARRSIVNLVIPGSNKPIMHLGPDSMTQDVFEGDADMIVLRQHVTAEFKEQFKEGVALYLNGDWANAKNILTKCDETMKELNPTSDGDGPCKTLLEYMSERGFVAPYDWKGYRPLTSK
eukprot:gene15176-20442_t